MIKCLLLSLLVSFSAQGGVQGSGGNATKPMLADSYLKELVLPSDDFRRLHMRLSVSESAKIPGYDSFASKVGNEFRTLNDNILVTEMMTK